MKRIAVITLVLTLGGTWWITEGPDQKNSKTQKPSNRYEVLARQVETETVGSLAYHQVLLQLKKELGKQERQENPHALIEAFRAIKTNNQGQSYRSGYLQSERQKALRKMKKNQEALPWIERGPGNCSGRIRAAIFDPSDTSGNTWFAASVGGGIWKTMDGGANWTNQTTELLTLSTTCLAIAASNPNVMYAGTGMGYGRVVDLAGSGVWKSVDHGDTWFQLQSTANGELLPAINRIIVDPDNENLVLVCSNGDYTQGGPNGGNRSSGIFRTTDGGNSWTQVYDPEPVFGPATDNRVQQLVADPTNFNYLYASVNEVGVVRSTDRGLTWQTSADDFALPGDIGNPPGGAASYQGISVRTELAISPSRPSRLYAAVERPYGIADLYMTDDRGESWSTVTDLGSDPNWFNSQGLSGAVAYTAGWFDNTIVVHPTNPDVVFVGGVSLYRIDVNPNFNSRSTSRISLGYVNPYGFSVVHSDMHDLQTFPDPSAPNGFRILNANDGGVAISPDGGASWYERDGLNTSQFYGVDKMPGANRYIGGLQDNGSYLSPMDPGPLSSWVHVTGGDGFETVWHPTDPQKILACSQYGTLYRSHDMGVTWETLSQSIQGNPPFITKIAGSKQDPDLLFSLSSRGIYRSEDFADTWSEIALPGTWIGHRAFCNVEISPASPQVVWATSRLVYDEAAGQPGGIYISTDSGLNFTEVTQNLPEGLTESSGLGFDPEDSSTAYLLFSAAGTPKILKTDDLGQSFVDLSGFTNSSESQNGFPDVAVYALLVMPHDPDILWAGTEIGLFVSENGGSSWSYADNGLPPVGIFQMSIVDGQIVVATYGRGIWTLDLPELQGYKPPQVTLNPRLTNVALDPRGNVVMDLDIRSAYDRTELMINGESVLDLPANSEPYSRKLLYPLEENNVFNLKLVAQKDGATYPSSSKSLQTFSLSPRKGGGTSFSNSDGYIAQGMNRTQPSGFISPALHTPHGYANNTEYICQFENPFVVPETGATIHYRDIALVEPGSGNGVFGNAQFWDYVIVEATSDGSHWIPLIDGYDARANAQWLNAYNTNSNNVTRSLFVSHEIDVLDTFSPGDQIFIRFRMWADGGVTGWGWVVDDISIFPDQETSDLNMSRSLVYSWASLNSQFESTIIANNPTSRPVDAILTARRSHGFGERTAVKTIPANGFLQENASELFPNLEDGPGFSVIIESDSDALKGRWVTKNLTTGTGGSPSQAIAVDLEESQPTKLLFGFMPTTDGFTSAPAVVSLTSGQTDLSFTRYSVSGESATAMVHQFTASDRPFAALVPDLFETSTEDYYLIAESSSLPIMGTAFVFNTFGEPSLGAINLIPDQDDNRDLLYPWISNSQDFESQLILNNLSDSDTTCTLTARRANGATETVVRVVPAHGFLSERASILFPGLPTGMGYSVQVEADHGPIYGRWVTFNLNSVSGKSPSQGVAYTGPPPNDEKDILFGFLPVTNQLISATVIVNRGPDPALISMHFFNKAGEEVDHLFYVTPLEPNIPATVIVNDVFQHLDEDVVAVARSDSSSICGVAFIFNQGREPAIGNAVPLENFELSGK